MHMHMDLNVHMLELTRKPVLAVVVVAVGISLFVATVALLSVLYLRTITTRHLKLPLVNKFSL